jgi:endo-1,4-beta-xylanase
LENFLFSHVSYFCLKPCPVPETQKFTIMVHLSNLALAISAVTAVFAAPTADSDSPDFAIGPQNLARRQDYTQNYKTGGNVNFSPSDTGYSVSFSGAGDFVVGKGWKTGTSR